MWEEIAEQPEVLRRGLRELGPAAGRAAEAIRASGATSVAVAARGSSDNAARYAQYLLGGRNRLSVALAAPALFGGYARPPSLEGAAVMAISQSGQSPDIVAVLSEARRQGRPAIAVTNDPGSPLAAEAGVVLDLRAGPELAVAATKTYTAELLAVAMLSAALGGDEGEGPVMMDTLARIPDLVASVVRSPEAAREAAAALRTADRCVVLGRGHNHATAFEWALKLQELCLVTALPLSTADFAHGPIALAEPGFPILAVAPKGPLVEEAHALLAGLVRDRGVDLVVASDAPDVLSLGRPIPLPGDLEEWATPLVAGVAAQVFCHALAVDRGLDPDRPRTLSKVTRTR